MPKKNSHCSYCGALFDDALPWPRKCAACGEMTFLNPIPVVVVLVPVDDGVLLICRHVEPRRGFMALPGGYVDLGETWQEAGAREVYEETGIRIDAAKLRAFQVHSGDYNTLLIFAIAAPLDSERPAAVHEHQRDDRARRRARAARVGVSAAWAGDEGVFRHQESTKDIVTHLIAYRRSHDFTLESICKIFGTVNRSNEFHRYGVIFRTCIERRH